MLVLQRTPQKANLALYNRIQSPRGFYMQNIFHTKYTLTKAHFPEETRNVFSKRLMRVQPCAFCSYCERLEKKSLTLVLRK